MQDIIQFSTTPIAVLGAIVGSLLGIIAIFLRRLLQQFDNLTATVKDLNATMTRIDKDLSGEVGVLQARTEAMQTEIRGLDSLWDRVREVEKDVLAIRKGGCEVRCLNEGRMQ